MCRPANQPNFAFAGIGPVAVEVQVQIAPGLPAFLLVGLPDKAVTESRERVRAARVLHCVGVDRESVYRHEFAVFELTRQNFAVFGPAARRGDGQPVLPSAGC